MSEGDNKVVPIGKAPARLRPEMIIRHLLSNVDRIRDLAIVATDNDNLQPTVLVSDRTNPYLLSMAGAILQDLATKSIPGGKK